MAIITPLLSVLLGSLLTLLATYLSNRSNDRRTKMQMSFEAANRKTEVLRERGEELYLLAQRWLHGFVGRYLNLRSVMKGDMTYNQFLDGHILNQKELAAKFELGRMELLIDAYFPQTKLAYIGVGITRDEIAKIENSHKNQYRSGAIDGSGYLATWDDAHNQFEEAGTRFKQSILDSIKEI